MKSIQPRKLKEVDPFAGSMEPIGKWGPPSCSRRMKVVVRGSTGGSVTCSSRPDEPVLWWNTRMFSVLVAQAPCLKDSQEL